jgi:hypothetical protein
LIEQILTVHPRDMAMMATLATHLRNRTPHQP